MPTTLTHLSDEARKNMVATGVLKTKDAADNNVVAYTHAKRTKLKAFRTMVNTTIADNDIKVQIGTYGNLTKWADLTAVTGSASTVQGVQSVQSLNDQIVPAGEAVLITFKDSDGLGTYYWYLDYEVFEEDYPVKS